MPDPCGTLLFGKRFRQTSIFEFPYKSDYNMREREGRCSAFFGGQSELRRGFPHRSGVENVKNDYTNAETAFQRKPRGGIRTGLQAVAIRYIGGLPSTVVIGRDTVEAGFNMSSEVLL